MDQPLNNQQVRDLERISHLVEMLVEVPLHGTMCPLLLSQLLEIQFLAGKLEDCAKRVIKESE